MILDMDDVYEIEEYTLDELKVEGLLDLPEIEEEY